MVKYFKFIVYFQLRLELNYKPKARLQNVILGTQAVTVKSSFDLLRRNLRCKLERNIM